jgi:hypothetical protein
MLFIASNEMPLVNAASPHSDMLLAAGHVPRHRHAQRRAERRARVAGAVAVMFAFRPQHEAVEAPRLADRIEPVIAAGQQFVHIGLVGNVEDKAVARRVEDVVQGQRQLDHAQVRADVAAGLRDAHNQPLAYLLGKLRQLRNRQPLHIRRRLDPAQQFFHAFAYFGPLHPLAASAVRWPQPSTIPISLTRFAAYTMRSGLPGGASAAIIAQEAHQKMSRQIPLASTPGKTPKYHAVPLKYQCLNTLRRLPWMGVR